MWSLSFILLLQKQMQGTWGRVGHGEKIMRRAPHIPFNLMAALACPVLTRSLGPSAPMRIPTMGRLMAWWLGEINVHLQKFKGVGFEVEMLVMKTRVSNLKKKRDNFILWSATCCQTM